MNRLFISTMATFMLLLASQWPTAIALALENPDTGPGCGLGKKLWDGWKGQKQIAPQMFMASTNVTGSYTFAITSGTSGCSNDGTIWDTQRVSLFIELNYASLKEDMARGGGEHIASLAMLMHVSVEHQPQFFALAQSRYASLIDIGEDNPVGMQHMLYDAMVNDPMPGTLARNP